MSGISTITMKMFGEVPLHWDENEKYREGGKWTVNREPGYPVSLDYTNPEMRYRGDSITGNAFWIHLDQLKTTTGLLHWMEYLSEKRWFNPHDFLMAVGEALEITDTPYGD